jgi:hypothetical protein
VPSGTYAIALAVPDEAALVALAARLDAAGTRFKRIVESDGPYSGQLTALGVTPCLKHEVRRVLSDIPLLHRANTVENYAWLRLHEQRHLCYAPGWKGWWQHLKDLL